MNFYKIETFISKRKLDAFSRQQDMHNIQHLLTAECVDSCGCRALPIPSSPSNDVIAKMVLAQFLKDENIYLTEITRIPVGESISFDHTFKKLLQI